ncbi:MAG TPA: DEAD/DEAH box helicase [Solirubrobacteraceae bacterium]|nr:DEAD/DEAH box helicase [Solirubrobacteraceae bacterium]
MSMQSFAELGVSGAVQDALRRRGINEPFPVQQLVIGDVLAGRDVLVRSPTGSGKTLAFAVPMVDSIEATDPRPAALILAPTRELVSQIADEMHAVAHARALRVTAVYGGVGLHKQSRDAARSHILVATPGRLEDLIERRAFSLNRVQILVLDEADRMLDMGFLPAVQRIVDQCPPERQTLFFSATLEGANGKVAGAFTRDAVRREHDPEPAVSNGVVSHRFVEIDHADRLEALVRELKRERDLALVFVRTKRGADRLVKRLGRHGVEAVAMHGDKTQGQRERALARFEAGHVDTLVATDVAARGIDVDRISHVINYDPPEDRDGYVHRVGRTGRAGRDGIGITLLSPEQRTEVVRLAGQLGLDHGLTTRGPFPAGRSVATASHAPGAGGHTPAAGGRPYAASGARRSGGNRRSSPSRGRHQR